MLNTHGQKMGLAGPRFGHAMNAIFDGGKWKSLRTRCAGFTRQRVCAEADAGVGRQAAHYTKHRIKEFFGGNLVPRRGNEAQHHVVSWSIKTSNISLRKV